MAGCPEAARVELGLGCDAVTTEPCDGLSSGSQGFCVHHIPGRKQPALCIKDGANSWHVVAWFRSEDDCQQFRSAVGAVADALGVPTLDAEVQS